MNESRESEFTSRSREVFKGQQDFLYPCVGYLFTNSGTEAVDTAIMLACIRIGG